MPDYAWDVFISYKRNSSAGRWIREAVRPVIEVLLGDFMNRPRIFLDDDGLDNGAPAQAILDELRRSRVVLAVWTPSYNSSDWCLTEWASMRAREGRARSAGWVGSLLYPVIHTPPGRGPVRVLGEEPVVREHARLSDQQGCAFGDRRSMRARAERTLRPIASDLAGWIDNSPAYAPDFPIDRQIAPAVPVPLPGRAVVGAAP